MKINKVWQVVLTIIVIISLFVGINFWTDNLRTDSEAASDSEQAGEEEQKAEIFAILRPDKDGQWYILDDAGHTPGGVDHLEQKNKKLILFYEEGMADLYWTAATPDESLIMKDIEVGMSVDRDRARIFLARDGVQVNPRDVNFPEANIWIYIEGRK